MRYRAAYSLYPRKMKNGKVVFYFRTYDADGNRTPGRSTGQTTKTAAHTYMNAVIKKGELLQGIDVTFEKYAQDWWIWDKCQYIRSKLVRGKDITRGYADVQRRYLDGHVLPEFGKLKLTAIRTSHIEKWLLGLKEKGKLTDNSINHCYAVLRVMLNEAERLEYISHNPIKNVQPLKIKQKEKSILLITEVKKLFDDRKINEIWTKPVYFAINLTSACTGVRLGEAQALQSQYVHSDYISIRHSWDRDYGLKDTKTKEIRDIPIPSVTSSYLSELKAKIPTGFIFSRDGGKTPIHHRSVTNALYLALDKTGISAEERKERNLSFHSWRHFFNTVFRGRVPDSKLQALTGHRTQEMTEYYTHFKVADFQDVLAVQGEIFNGKD